MNIKVKSNYLIYNDIKYQCSIGRGGFTNQKKEGDGCTPRGTFKITDVFYRNDRLKTIKTNIKTHYISPSDGWCDDPDDELYNKKIIFPFSHSAEKLYREDNLYNIVCIINYNTEPIVPHAGSAIFMHVAKNNYAATDGCIALDQQDLIEILSEIKDTTELYVGC